MLSVVFIVLPGAFGFLVWNAYRIHRAQEAAGGRGFVPRGGARRWTDLGG